MEKPVYKIIIHTTETETLEFDTLGFLESPTGTSAELDIREADLKAGGFSVVVANGKTGEDKDSVSTQIYRAIQEDGILFKGAKVELLKDNIIIHRGILKSVSNDIFETEYTLVVGDLQSELLKTIFDRELSKYIDYNGAEETLSQLQTRLPVNFSIIERDIPDSDPVEKERIITYSGHPMQLALDILRIVYAGEKLEAGESLRNDVNFENFVDVDSFNKFQTPGDPDRIEIVYYFEWKEVLDSPLEFIREYIYKPCSVYPIFTVDGKLRIKKYAQPTANGAGIEKINESNILEITRNENEFDELINKITIDSDYDFPGEYYATKDIYVEAPSFDKFKKLLPEDSPQSYDFVGVDKTANSSVEKELFKNTCRGTVFSRFSTSSKYFEFKMILETTKYLAGDYIEFEHKKVIDWNDGPNRGKRGINIEGVGPDPNAVFNSGDEWGSWIGNVIGVYKTMQYVVFSQQILSESFNGTQGNKSLLENFQTLDSYLNSEGF